MCCDTPYCNNVSLEEMRQSWKEEFDNETVINTTSIANTNFSNRPQTLLNKDKNLSKFKKNSTKLKSFDGEDDSEASLKKSFKQTQTENPNFLEKNTLPGHGVSIHNFKKLMIGLLGFFALVVSNDLI